ncbi:nitroreductase family protein [Vagococcus entomophilus]|uniref:Nitroreductase family protein n=1 Tax=Vagococcus entomophilus TaxID=1160095 RepID=A0A430AHU9_9ENTE|nr:nitroreductase family protein [Vagococcus entomophilus]RSU07682.1 nitroreductase family protein [Vagococcus entomophilus]
MQKQLENNFQKIFKGRRSIRSYDPKIKISKEEMQNILADATLAPSSVNMQPWRFVVVETPEAKDKLRPLIRFNTTQNDTSSAMILIFGDMQCYEFAEEIYNQAVIEGKMPEEVKEKQLGAILPHYKNLTSDQMNDIVKIDSSLVAMQLMLVARAYGYDTNPIGGFEADKLAETFDLDPTRYVPVMILSIGVAADTGYESVRLPINKLTEWK